MKEYRCFSNPEEVDKWVENFYTNEELKELGEDKIFALLFYKGIGYNYMNNCVRHGITNPEDVVDIESLQELLLSKRIKEAIEVCRFVDFNELKILWRNTAGKRVYEYPAFLSTTLLRDYYSMDNIKRGRFPITIKIPEGVRGTYLPEINPYMPEYEILLSHHTKMRRISLFVFEVLL